MCAKLYHSKQSIFASGKVVSAMLSMSSASDGAIKPIQIRGALRKVPPMGNLQSKVISGELCDTFTSRPATGGIYEGRFSIESMSCGVV